MAVSKAKAPVDEVTRLKGKVKQLNVELKAERELVEKLRYKLSPKASPTVVDRLRKALSPDKLAGYKVQRGKGDFYELAAPEAFFLVYGYLPNLGESAATARALKALLWEEFKSTGCTRYRIETSELGGC